MSGMMCHQVHQSPRIYQLKAKLPSLEGTKTTNDVEQSSDETESTNSTESGGLGPKSDYDGDYDVEMSDPAKAKMDETVVLEAIDLRKREDDIDLLLQEIYIEYRPIFPLATLAMELVSEVGRHLAETQLVKFLNADKTIAGHPVVCLRLL